MYRRESDLQRSIDDREISGVKKTFEEMLEEALKKEGGGTAPAMPPIEEESRSRGKSTFLKKNTSKRRFLKRKNPNEKKKKQTRSKKRLNVGQKNATKNKKPKKVMTDSMLEFEQIEQINLKKSLENIVPGKIDQNWTRMPFPTRFPITGTPPTKKLASKKRAF